MRCAEHVTSGEIFGMTAFENVKTPETAGVTAERDKHHAPEQARSFKSWLSRDSNGLLVGAAAGYVLLYLCFWPLATAIMDESAYLNMAWAMRHGTVYLDVAGISSVFSYPTGGGRHIITQYPPGMPAVLALTSLAGWKMAMGTNLIVLLALFAVTVKILRSLRLPGAFALLMLLHPTAVMYSRTVMSDLVSSLLVATAFLCYLHRRYMLLGLLIGIAVMGRTATGIVLIFFLLGILLDGKTSPEGQTVPISFGERVRNGVLVGIGALPGIAFAWWYQHAIQEGGWTKYSAGGQMGLHNFPRIFPAYMLSLLILYPGMLLAPLFYRGRGRAALWGLTYGIVLFYSLYHFQDSTDNKLQSLILGQRYMLTAMPMFIVAYAALIWRFAQKWNPKFLAVSMALALLALFVVAGAAHRVHNKYLQRGVEVRDTTARVVAPRDILFANVHLSKMLHPAWTGPRPFVLFGPLDQAKLNEHIQKALQKTKEQRTGGRVIVAHWSRQYRPETEGEHRVIKTVKAAFITRQLEGSQPANNFDELNYLEIISPRPKGPQP